MFPTLFISHGSPMHAQDAGSAGAAWAAVTASLPRPKAVMMVSAHWETAQPTLGSAAQPATIHDFGGFPEALYKIRYPAPGAPDVAQRAAKLLADAGIAVTQDAQRGLDHGAWVPMQNMFKHADVQVLQLSVQTRLGTRHHLAVGRALHALRDEVLIVASGHVTHNLRDAISAMQGQVIPGSVESATGFQHWFDAKVMARDIDALLDYRTLQAEGARAHPTEEHFMPLFVALGAAMPIAASSCFYTGMEWQSLVMDAYRFD